MKWLTTFFDILIVIALAEQLFWEGDSIVFTLFASALGVVVLPSMLIRGKEKRLILTLPLALLLTFILSFKLLVAIDVSIYKRLVDIQRGTSIAISEILSYFSLLFLAYLSISNQQGYRYGAKLTAAACFFAVVIISAAYIWFGKIFELSIVTTGYTLRDLWDTLAVALIFLRILLSGPIPIWSSKIDDLISKATSLLIGALLVSTSILGLQSAYLIWSKPLSLRAEGDYAVSRPFLLALLVNEDPIFLHHQGVDFKRIRDVVRETLEQRRYERGASTIPMQLAKVYYLTDEKSMFRKVRQTLLGILLDAAYSKEELLKAYIEEIPYGPQIKGLTMASKHFFDCSPSDLNMEQGIKLVLAIYDPKSFDPASKTESPRIVVRTALTSSRIRRYNRTLLSDLEGFMVTDGNHPP